MHNAVSDTQSSLDSGCRFTADPLGEFKLLLRPLDPNSSFGLLFWDWELSRHNQVLIKPGEGLDIQSEGKRGVYAYVHVYIYTQDACI